MGNTQVYSVQGLVNLKNVYVSLFFDLFTSIEFSQVFYVGILSQNTLK